MTGQQTFELVPTTLVKSNGQRRPMTSKAAKKAYQQANRGPKISKVEQHRRDKAELEQQKREFEKEQAAARAKAAREKKAAKANAERDVRRRNGLPEPNKYVHASQPTISSFVRSSSANKRTWQQMETVAEDSDKTLSDTDRDDSRLAARRPAFDEGSDNEFGEFPSLSQPELLEQIDSSIILVKDRSVPGPLEKGRASSQTRRHETSQELPRMKEIKEIDEDVILNSQELDEMVSTQVLSDLVEAVTKSDSIEPPDRLPAQHPEEIIEAAPKSRPSQRRSGRVAGKFKKTAGGLNTKKLSTVPVVEISRKLEDTIQPSTVLVGSPEENGMKSPTPKATLQGRSTNMPPPRLPTKVEMATGPIPIPKKPSFPSRNVKSLINKPLPNPAPSSTQAFLENHLDDFFPSPTQEVRELLDEEDDLPLNTQVAKHISPEKAGINGVEKWFSTQDLILSPEDLVEIITPYRTSQKPPGGVMSEASNRLQHAHVATELNLEGTKNDLEDFVCTQDLILSPEDIAEICSPCRAPPRSPHKTNPEPPNNQVLQRRSAQEKGRFFQEKEEDLYHAAIQESKATSAQETAKAPLNTLASLRRNPLDSTDHAELDSDLLGRCREKEDEDFKAAIRESKITAELEAKRFALAGLPVLHRIHSNPTDCGDIDIPRLFGEQGEGVRESTAGAKSQELQHLQDSTANNGTSKPRRFFEEKYEDQLHAAMHESKMLTANTIPPREDTEKPKRTLKRVLSTATDYGDDFSGCIQELLDLC